MGFPVNCASETRLPVTGSFPSIFGFVAAAAMPAARRKVTRSRLHRFPICLAQPRTGNAETVPGERTAMGERVADYLLQRLSDWGVKRVYGYPGDGINAI